MKIRNLTPHPVVVAGVTIPPEPSPPPRVAEEATQVETVTISGHTVPVVEVRLGQVTGLPEPQPDTLLIVSRMVAEAAPTRRDLVVPYDAIRDGDGRIIGVRALGRIPEEGK